MGGNVVNFTGVTRLDRDPKRVIDEAGALEFERVIVIGVTADGGEYVSASAADGGTFLWDIERAKLRLLRMGDEE